MTDARQRGLALFGEIMGPERAAAMREGCESDGLTGAMAQLATEYCFGSVWSREGLARRDRSLLTIGVLIAQRQTAELKNHLRIGLANGLTKPELEEAVLQSLPYCGFPTATSAMTALIEVLRDAGVETEVPTPEERGLL